ncbi:ABC transporter [Streptomyces cavernicola]|uniref:ABC transporter n=1 Tax=Streptomyces cavernicola TaxID=3043613 RepID=A0ABT6S2K5_9ACTN|nr:ABC transporter [Streptomyces sp. B-S-A6]MDI3402312.1 ABC transporter [Streptomyces sp. B-S-A6]
MRKPPTSTALLRYHTALLLRSQRWLPPVLVYAALVAVGAQPGDPVLDSLGYTSAALLPVAAWLTRISATQEPPAARHVTASAAGPGRAHLAALLTASGCAAALGTAGSALVVAMSGWWNTSHEVRIAPLPMVLAALLAVAVCVLLGTAVGALCTWPLLRSPGWSVSLTALLALLAIVTTGSPARETVWALITGSRTGTTPVLLLPLAGAALLAVAAGATVCGVCSRRG